MTDLFGDAVKNVVELKLIKDYVALESDNGNVNLQLINERFNNKNGLIMFYSPTCPFCKDMGPRFTELSKVLKNSFPLGAVNCIDSKNGNDLLGDYFKISAYPTIKYYNNGTYTDYSGGRNVKDFLNYLCKSNGLCNF
jgi:thiol-disulfide isomerase/thioredoxin